mmetsp:Transcript_66134/g.184147  ORF Transcript_66134/g.184147 Transcript_66134/m.184147 type:complete len:125 (+) Transcript_66134:2-376(+)
MQYGAPEMEFNCSVDVGCFRMGSAQGMLSASAAATASFHVLLCCDAIRRARNGIQLQCRRGMFPKGSAQGMLSASAPATASLHVLLCCDAVRRGRNRTQLQCRRGMLLRRSEQAVLSASVAAMH